MFQPGGGIATARRATARPQGQYTREFLDACRTVNTPVGVLLHVDLLVVLAPHPAQASRLTTAGVEAKLHTDGVQVVGGGLDAQRKDLGVRNDGAVREPPGHPAVICSQKSGS